MAVPVTQQHDAAWDGMPETPEARALLSRAVEEVARLLRADGAIIYLVDHAENRLRFAFDAGIREPEAQRLIRDLSLPVGVGIFGHSIARREVVVTGDYPNDARFEHSPVADRIVSLVDIRSMAAAPLIADGEVIGALGAYTSRADDFGEADVALLRALADHAAAAIANQRLIARLAASQAELARRVEAQRTLGEMATQLTSLRDPSTVLEHALRAAVRLLGGDGGQIGTVAPDDEGRLRWAEGHSLVHERLVAFTKEDRTPVEHGVSGRALREGRPSWTTDYIPDTSFPHDEPSDRVARELGIRAVIAAPLLGDAGPIGAIGVYAERPDAFGAEDAELLGLLADQVAIVLTNARLNAAAEVAAQRLRAQAELQGRLLQINQRLLRTLDPASVLELIADGLRGVVPYDYLGVYRVDHDEGVLQPVLARDRNADAVLGFPIPRGEGITWWSVEHREPVLLNDALDDPRVIQIPGTPREEEAIVIVPLISGDEVIGAMNVARRGGPDVAFTDAEFELAQLFAAQAAIAIANARLYGELRARMDAQRSLAEIAAGITSLRDAEDILQRTVEAAARLLGAEAADINLLDDPSQPMRWAFGVGPFGDPAKADASDQAAVVRMGEGIAGAAIERRTTVWTDDYLADPGFRHLPGSDAFMRRHNLNSSMAAPMLGERGPLGTLTIMSPRRRAFGPADAELLKLLADQAAIAVTNARLYEELRDRADAQRTLAEIASQIASLRDPSTVLQRAVSDAARLLRADRAQVNLVREGGDVLDPPIAAAPTPPSGDDVVVPIGSGIAGLAARDCRVWWTGDYLADTTFPHDEGDEWIRVQGIRSMMSAPLREGERLVGTITVQSTQADAFREDHAELLSLLADQAAIALTNARLYAELRASERRYRHLVDYSPDIVWSVDAEGRFTFLSDSLESRTGWKPEDLIGKPFTVLAGGSSIDGAQVAWEALKSAPDEEQRVQLDLPLANGEISKAEVALAATVVDGRFAGAHGSVRDISERERLEGDLREQAAEIAASEERAHLARELHDSVTQALFSMGLTLRTLELLLDSDVEAARAKVTELRELQKDALAEMRTLIFELRPASLENDGLVQALRTHATAVQRRTGLAIVVDAEPIDRLALPVEEALYRIGQEAIHNVVKHANASRAVVRIARDGDRVSLSVADDGAGFDPDKVPRGHLGLLGMRQRLDLVGGELRVDSRIGRGTTIEARVPTPEPSAE